MFPCSSCHRHLRDSDDLCPFCGTEQLAVESSTATNFALGCVLVAAMLACGCAKDSVGATDSSSESESSTVGTTTAEESGESETETSAGTDTNDSANTTNSPGLSFYAGADDFTSVSECDPFAQDCPEGEKCVPYGSTGGNWDANKCVPVTGDGQPGDPCVYGGVVEASDDCDESSHCWDVMDVDGMNIGVCTPFCTGTPDDPICPMGTGCLIANEGSITLCLDTCDPLLQDCGPGLGCYWSNDDFYCIFATQDIPGGEPCGFINDCVPGTYCTLAGSLPDCAGSACCTDLCALDDIDACPEPELECTAFFDENMAPPGLENIGACLGPGA